MNEIKCPECGSTNIKKQESFAATKPEGQPVKPAHIVPNECREENCGHKWFDEE